MSSASPPPDGQWPSDAVVLSTAAFGANLSGVPANLDQRMIKGEFHNGVTVVVGLDNIRSTAVPEPGTLAPWPAGLGAGLMGQMGQMGLGGRRRGG